MVTRNKGAKFIELANKRVNKAIKDIQLVGNLANRTNYEFTDEQAGKIIRALQQEVDQVKQSFKNTEEAGRSEFKL
jgi:ABC-type Fe3+-hydroxamate transport system substrate-binding protein